MASALLASRNEPSWGENKVYMRKNPNSNPNPRLRPAHNPSNPSPNSNPSHIFSPHGGSAHRNHLHAMEPDDPPTADPDTAVAVSDNCSSFNRRDPGGYVTFNISAYSKKELRELRRRLMSELEQVRSVSYRLSARELQAASARSAGYSAFGGGREVTSSAAPPPTAGSDALIDRSGPPRANQTCRPHEIKKWGSAANPEMRKLVTTMMKKCGQILSRLMKHKGAIWFNTPVDAVKMNLPDYHQVIKSPMDLGTVKTKLRKGLYSSPLDFAFDIRLTFQNALLYNPKEHQVHTFAGMLLQQFEGLFGPPFSRYEKQLSSIVRNEEELRQRALNLARVAPLPLEAATKANHSPPLVYSPRPVRALAELRPLPPPAAGPAVHAQPPKHQQQLQQQPRRIPKPKVKDVNKRPMTIEEKEKLSIALQNLPDDKSSQMLQIMQKRKVGMSMEGDVVELDFEQMDNETLWELDRFVFNMEKKRKHEEAEMTKKRRQEETAGGSHYQLTQNASSAAAPHSPPPPLSPRLEAGNKSPLVAAVVDDETPEAGAAKRSKRGDPVDEDVDIGDEMPVPTYPSVEIEKEGGGGGGSSSSSSSSSGSDRSSSSSSDSDSDSSSGSDSDSDDEDEVEQPPPPPPPPVGGGSGNN